MSSKTVSFDVVLTFPNKDLQLDPNRYTGNEPRILEALLQTRFANKKGFLTPKGRRYFASDQSRFIESPLSSFLESNYDNYDRECARRDYRKYVSECPRKVTLSFNFNAEDFKGDPLRYEGKIDPLLVKQEFFNKNGYLTSKAVRSVANNKEKMSVRVID